MKKLFLGLMLALFFVGSAQAQELKDSFEVFFEFNKAVLRDQSKAKVDSFLALTNGRRLKVRVTGHTCDIGTDNYNMGLSEKRAISAFEYLKSRGEKEDKIELFFYGEKDPKYMTRPENRRVFVLFSLEDDDRDTLLKSDCLSIFVEKGTFKPNKNKDIQFEYKTFTTAPAVKMAGIVMEDENGKKLFANGIAYFDAKVSGASLEPGKTVKVKLPAVGADEEGFMLYKGVNNGGKITWKSTGRPCGATEKEANCATYNFEWSATGYCACAKPRLCPEDCSDNPFGGERAPSLTDASVRYSAAKTVAKFPEGIFPSALADLKVDVIDDTKFEEDCDICEQFSYGIGTDEWFPAFRNVKAVKNIIVKAKDNSNNAVNGDANKTLRVMVPRDQVKDLDNPILLPGTRHSKGYVKWDVAKYEQTKCLGPINCDYVVFDVPGTGNYKLGTWSDAKADDSKEEYILKTRVLKNSTVLVGNKADGYVYKAKNASKGSKTREKEYIIKGVKDMNKLVFLVKNETKDKKSYQEANLSELIYKAGKKMYVMRKRDFTKVKEWKEMDLSKCK